MGNSEHRIIIKKIKERDGSHSEEESWAVDDETEHLGYCLLISIGGRERNVITGVCVLACACASYIAAAKMASPAAAEEELFLYRIYTNNNKTRQPLVFCFLFLFRQRYIIKIEAKENGRNSSRQTGEMLGIFFFDGRISRHVANSRSSYSLVFRIQTRLGKRRHWRRN